MYNPFRGLNRNAKMVAGGTGLVVGSSVVGNLTAPVIIAAKAKGAVAVGAVVLNTLSFLGFVTGCVVFTIGMIDGVKDGWTEDQNKYKNELARDGVVVS